MRRIPDRGNLHFHPSTDCLGATIRTEGMLTDKYRKGMGMTGVELEVNAKNLAELSSKKHLSSDAADEVHLTGPFRRIELVGAVHGLEGHICALTGHDGKASDSSTRRSS